MAYDVGLAKIAIFGAQQSIAAVVETANVAAQASDISAEELAQIKAWAKLTDTEVDQIVDEARDRLGV